MTSPGIAEPTQRALSPFPSCRRRWPTGCVVEFMKQRVAVRLGQAVHQLQDRASQVVTKYLLFRVRAVNRDVRHGRVWRFTTALHLAQPGTDFPCGNPERPRDVITRPIEFGDAKAD